MSCEILGQTVWQKARLTSCGFLGLVVLSEQRVLWVPSSELLVPSIGVAELRSCITFTWKVSE